MTFKNLANITGGRNAVRVGLDLQGRFKLLWKFNHHGRFPFSMTNWSDLLGAVKHRRYTLMSGLSPAPPQPWRRPLGTEPYCRINEQPQVNESGFRNREIDI